MVKMCIPWSLLEEKGMNHVPSKQLSLDHRFYSLSFSLYFSLFHFLSLSLFLSPSLSLSDFYKIRCEQNQVWGRPSPVQTKIIEIG